MLLITKTNNYIINTIFIQNSHLVKKLIFIKVNSLTFKVLLDL